MVGDKPKKICIISELFQLPGTFAKLDTLQKLKSNSEILMQKWRNNTPYFRQGRVSLLFPDVR